MIKFSNSFLDEIRGRISISEIVRRKVALKNNGREFSGLCPFHKEKSPSFTVSDEKGFYHCFGCGAHGDIIKFTMETEGLSFPETVEQLAAQAGLAMPKMTEFQVQHEKQQTSLFEIMELTKNWFVQMLYAPEGRIAREYLEKRMLGKIAAEIFALGYAPESRNALREFLKTKGITDVQMFGCGLLAKNERGEVYDKFRGRLMFPIFNVRGQVIAFGGRTLGDGQPKYLNSPETQLFKKGDVLYNEHLARKVSFKTGRLVIAEGYMDVIALYMAGIKEVVAPLGTAVTENQLLRVWNLSKEPILCLDGDSAGQRAMLRAATLGLPILKPGVTMKFASMPVGLDPDDVIKTMGVEKLAQMLKKSRSLSDVLWNNELTKIGIKTPEARALLEKNLNEMALKIKDTNVANHYKNFFREKMRGVIFGKNKSIKSNKEIALRLTNLEEIPEITAKSRAGAESLAILIIIYNPEIIDNYEVMDELINIDFSDSKLDEMRREILDLYHLQNPLNKESLLTHLEKTGYKPDITRLDRLGMYQADYGNFIDKVIQYWKYALGIYNLATLREECNQLAIIMTEESEIKASEMRKQIEKLEADIFKMELDFVEN